MKKILLILVATLGLTANAQTGFKKSDIFVEGSFSYAKEKGVDATYSFAPTAGYFLTDKFAVGAQVEKSNTMDKLSAGVFARCYFLNVGKDFKVFSGLNFNTNDALVDRPNVNASLGLGVNYFVIDQVKQSKSDKINYLREFIPNADPNDWVLETAGQRVQVIKKDANGKGILEFGTEVIKSSDGSLAVLLGASPGASTAVSIMIDLIEKCFSEDFNQQLSNIIPSYGKKLNDDKKLCQEIRNKTNNLF